MRSSAPQAVWQLIQDPRPQDHQEKTEQLPEWVTEGQLGPLEAP